MRLSVAAILCLLCSSPLLKSQSSTAAIEGLVINSQNGRVIPRANVLVRSIRNINNVKSVRADDSGHFSISGLDPGAYRLTAEQQSFFSDSRRRLFQPTVDLSSGELRHGLLVPLLPTAVVTHPDELINDTDLLHSYEDRGEAVIVGENGRYSPLLYVISAE